MSGEKLVGKKAIVSGGSRGIGRGIALTLAAEGADVAFCHYKDDEKASQTVADIEALGRKRLRLIAMCPLPVRSRTFMQPQ